MSAGHLGSASTHGCPGNGQTPVVPVKSHMPVRATPPYGVLPAGMGAWKYGSAARAR
jgi:hypothetical protein